MNCLFPLPTRFESKTSFERNLKKQTPAVQNEVAEVIDCFMSGDIPEKYRPQKIQPFNENNYRIRIRNHRLIYNLDENDETLGILKSILPRAQSYQRRSV